MSPEAIRLESLKLACERAAIALSVIASGDDDDRFERLSDPVAVAKRYTAFVLPGSADD